MLASRSAAREGIQIPAEISRVIKSRSLFCNSKKQVRLQRGKFDRLPHPVQRSDQLRQHPVSKSALSFASWTCSALSPF